MLDYFKNSFGKPAAEANPGTSESAGLNGRGAGAGAGVGPSRANAASRSTKRMATVALAGVLAMLASVLVLVAPTASPASAQTTYDFSGIVVLQIWDFNGSGNRPTEARVTQIETRKIPSGVRVHYTITPRAQGDPRATTDGHGDYPADGCTAEISSSGTMGGRADTQRIDAGSSALILSPADSTHNCVYDVAVPDFYDSGTDSWYGCADLNSGIPLDTVIEPGTERQRTADFMCEKILTYDPAITVTLPSPFAFMGRADTSLAGEMIEVDVANADSECVGEITLEVDGTSMMARLSPDSALYDQPAGVREAGRCAGYTLTFPADNGGKLAKDTSAMEDTDVTMDDTEAASAYQRAQATFDLDIEVSGLDALNSETIDVTVTAVSADSATGDHATCSNRATVTLTWDDTAMKHTGSQADLIDYPQGADAASDLCTYDIVWPAPTGHMLDSTTATMQASGAATMATATYTAGSSAPPGPGTTEPSTTYSSAILRIWNFNHASVTVPTSLARVPARIVPAGVTYQFRVTPRAEGDARGTYPASGCTPTDIYENTTDSSSRIERSGRFSNLVRRPAGASNDCVYDVEWFPSWHADSMSWYGCHLMGTNILNDRVIDSELNGDGELEVGTACEKIITYAANPTFTIDLPPSVMIPGSPASSIEGETIEVAVAPDSAETVSNCGGMITLEVDSSGMATLTGDSALWDQPAGERTSCTSGYDLTFPADNGGKLVKVASTSEDTRVVPSTTDPAATDTAAASAYQRAQATFDLDIEVSGLDALSSDTIEVTVTAVSADSATGDHATCSNRATVTLTWDDTAMKHTGSQADLIDYPLGATAASDLCIYDIGWPTPTGHTLDSTTATMRASGAATMATATYTERSPGTTFTPEISIQVPNYPDDADPTLHYYETIEFEVGFARSGGPANNCTDDFTHIYVVEGNTNAGVAQPQGGAPTLIDVPDGANDSCVYTVTFPMSVSGSSTSGQSYTLTRQGDMTMTGTVQNTADPTDRQLARQYEAGDILFSRSFLALVPSLTDGGTNSLYSGTEIVITLSPREGSPAACQTTTVSLTISDPGTTNTRTPELVDRPAGETGRCVYDVMSPEYVRSAASVTPPWTLKRGLVFPQSTDAACPSGTIQELCSGPGEARYHQVFAPPVTVRVPQVSDPDDSTRNAFAGARLTATVAKMSSDHAECSSGNAVWTVQPDGTVTTDFDFIEYPRSQSTRCSYTITFPDSGTPAQAGDSARLELTGTAEHTVAHDTANFEVVYRSVFSPRYVGREADQIWVPFIDPGGDGDNLLGGATFTVAYAPAVTNPAQHADCSPAVTQNYVVEIVGTRSGGGGAEVVDGEDLVDLVDVPVGQSTRCLYTADYSDSFDKMYSGATHTFHLVTEDNREISGATGDIFAAYGTGTLFRANVEITVPPRKALDNMGMETDTSAFWHVDPASRPIFFVAIARSGGPASGCSDAITRARFDIEQDGTVSTFLAIILIDVPRGESTSCEYEVTSTDPVMSAASVMPPWTLSWDSGRPPTLSAANPMAVIRYFEGDSEFTPSITITVPQIDGETAGTNLFAGTAFTVAITPAAGAHSDCVGASYTYTVQGGGATDGTTTPDRAVTALVNVPQGQTTPCAYAVSIRPAQVNSAGSAALAWRLEQDSGASTTAGGGSTAISAGYSLAADLTYELGFDVTVPPYNADDDPATAADESASHAFAGAQIAVGIARTSGPATGCTADTTITWTVQPSGQLTTSDDLTLIEYPMTMAGMESARCVYEVTWPDPVTGGAGGNLNRHTAATATARSSSRNLAAEYRAGMSNFMPSVSGTVELVDENEDSTHDLSGVTLEVGYAPVDGSDAACTTPAGSETYTIGDDGALSLTSAAVMLVDRPAGVNARCVYALTYPAEVSAAADPADPAADAVSVPVARGTLTQLTAADELVLNYARPSAPVRVSVEPVPLMSANRGVARLPVQVALSVPSGAFILGDTFEVLVWVPGACGTDTFLFGGVPASSGVAYAAPAIGSGQVVVVGEGASLLNRQAAYSLPPYVDGAAGREACAVRVSVLSTPPGCSLAGSVGTDDLGRSYVEAVWSQGSVGFDLTASFDCSRLVAQGVQGSVSLGQGWVTLPFNGATGTSPEEFARALSGAVSSVWVWNAGTQSWNGWTTRHGEVGLSSLTQGETVMAYVHSDTTITYSPEDLLEPRDAGGSLSLAPRYSLHTFGGDRSARLSGLIRQPSPVAVVFLWHAETQSWRYNLPGRRPIASLDIVWFDTLNPGDTVFLYNQGSQPTTIGWS